MASYLDTDGLEYFWEKIQGSISSNASHYFAEITSDATGSTFIATLKDSPQGTALTGVPEFNSGTLVTVFNSSNVMIGDVTTPYLDIVDGATPSNDIAVGTVYSWKSDLKSSMITFAYSTNMGSQAPGFVEISSYTYSDLKMSNGSELKTWQGSGSGSSYRNGLSLISYGDSTRGSGSKIEAYNADKTLHAQIYASTNLSTDPELPNLSQVLISADRYHIDNQSQFASAMGWYATTDGNWRIIYTPVGTIIATRTVSGSVAVTSSYASQYISSALSVTLPPDVFTTIDYAHGEVQYSPGLWRISMTSVTTSTIGYYLVTNASTTATLTRRFIVIGQ